MPQAMAKGQVSHCHRKRSSGNAVLNSPTRTTQTRIEPASSRSCEPPIPNLSETSLHALARNPRSIPTDVAHKQLSNAAEKSFLPKLH